MDYEEKLGYRNAVAVGIRDGWIIPPNEEDAAVSYRSKYKRIRPPDEEFAFQKKSVSSARKALNALRKAKTNGRVFANAKIRLGLAEKRLVKARDAMGLTPVAK